MAGNEALGPEELADDHDEPSEGSAYQDDLIEQELKRLEEQASKTSPVGPGRSVNLVQPSDDVRKELEREFRSDTTHFGHLYSS